MAKLNKQEVTAVANKLHRELKNAADKAREEAIRNYTPSENYLEIKKLLEERDKLRKQIEALEEQKDTILNDLRDKLDKKYSLWYAWASESAEKICDKMVDIECKLKEVPDVEHLKDDVTIAAIDDCFDTATFIEAQIANFK